MSTQANRSHAYLPPRLTHTYYPIQTHTLQHQRPESSNIHEKKMNQSLKNERPRQKQVDSLRRINQQLKERQQIYLQKLMKLQEGLQNQHRQFIKLQDLYTELFESYKQKELEIMECTHQLIQCKSSTGKPHAKDSQIGQQNTIRIRQLTGIGRIHRNSSISPMKSTALERNSGTPCRSSQRINKKNGFQKKGSGR